MNIKRLMKRVTFRGDGRREAAQRFVLNQDRDLTEEQGGEFLEWLAVGEGREEQYRLLEDSWELSGDLAHDPELQRIMNGPLGGQAPQVPQERMIRLTYGRLASSVAAAAAVLLLAVALWAHFTGGVYTTAAGEQRLVSLEDGSIIQLNTATRLSVRMTGQTRRIVLERGEALFDVASDKARPFLVEAGGGVARALGTRFNVDRRNGSVTVSVLEGVVRVAALGGGAPAGGQVLAELGHGEAVTYDGHAGAGKVAAADIGRINAWRVGRVKFTSETLGRAADELNRYSRKTIVLADEGLEGMLVTGTFRIGGARAMVKALARTHGIEVEETARNFVLRPKG